MAIGIAITGLMAWVDLIFICHDMVLTWRLMLLLFRCDIYNFRGSAMKILKLHLRRFSLSEDGATAVEYALLGALIAVVIVAAVTSTGLNLQALFINVAAEVGAAVTGAI